MATNGNNPEQTSSADRLESQLQRLAESKGGPREIDNFALRMDATAQACDELAAYCQSFGRHLRKASADFSANVAQMMGKIAG